MKTGLRIALLMGFVLLTAAGCGTLSHRNLGEDLPSHALTAEPIRGAPPREMLDYGKFWLPFIYGIRSWLYRVDGNRYEAFKTKGIGPFALLVRYKSEALYGPNGRMVMYQKSGSIVWGLIFRRRNGRAYTNAGWRRGSGTSILFGLIGYDRRYDGSARFSILFLPVFMRRPEPGIKLLDQRAQAAP